jgi:hypothetical protein
VLIAELSCSHSVRGAQSVPIEMYAWPLEEGWDRLRTASSDDKLSDQMLCIMFSVCCSLMLSSQMECFRKCR